MFKTITSDMIAAMKSGDKDKLLVLRSLIAECKNIRIEMKETSENDQVCMTAINRTVKRMNASIEQFEKGGRNDLVDKEKAQLDIISVYLPKALSGAETIAAVDKALVDLQTVSKKDTGKIVTYIKSNYPGVDMKIVMPILQERLS
jgi:uncharacterized protein YqeY